MNLLFFKYGVQNFKWIKHVKGKTDTKNQTKMYECAKNKIK